MNHITHHHACPCSVAKNAAFFYRGMGSPLIFGTKREMAHRFAAQGVMLSTAKTNGNRDDTDYAFEMAGSNIRYSVFLLVNKLFMSLTLSRYGKGATREVYPNSTSACQIQLNTKPFFLGGP